MNVQRKPCHLYPQRLLEGQRPLGLEPHPGAAPAASAIPQKKLKFVHIAGTNGKGSTAAMLSSILERSRPYRGGLYTSPFINRFNERMQVDHHNCIPDEELAELTDYIRPHADSHGRLPHGVRADHRPGHALLCPPQELRHRGAGGGHGRRPGLHQRHRHPGGGGPHAPWALDHTRRSWAPPWRTSPPPRPASSSPAAQVVAYGRNPGGPGPVFEQVCREQGAATPQPGLSPPLIAGGPFDLAGQTFSYGELARTCASLWRAPTSCSNAAVAHRRRPGSAPARGLEPR